MKLGLIDLGSNSARMYLAKLEKDGFQILARRRTMTRLSEGMGKDGVLQEMPISRTIAVLKDFAQEIKTAGAYPFAVATAAVRKATNQQEFCEKVKAEAGFPLFVIGGQTEAFFDFQGVMAALPGVEDALICDTGGGSTELILSKGRALQEKISLPFGAMSLTDVYGQNLHPAKDVLIKQLKEVAFLEEAKGFPLIGIGGSLCALAGLDGESSVNGCTLSAKRVEEIFDTLLPLSPKERVEYGVETGRADTVCGGILPGLLLLKELAMPKLILSTGGLREGILAELQKDQPEFYSKHPEDFLKNYDAIEK
ncbi:MAG: exopolyphosphatase [Clostridia bacterium]|nr:exopolyphosphatase [Clostridia bacterium]